jgi:hypothetical protein
MTTIVRLARVTVLALAFFGMLALNVPTVAADDRNFTFVNGVAVTLKALYVDKSSSPVWTDNILGRDVLAPGESTFIKFSKFDGTTCMWDIYVEGVDGSYAWITKVNLCEVLVVTVTGIGNDASFVAN